MARRVVFSNEVLKDLDGVVFYLESRWSKAVAKKIALIFYKKVDAIATQATINKFQQKVSPLEKYLLQNRTCCTTKFLTTG